MSLRIAALWFPDWPAQAARLVTEKVGPLAVVARHRVRVCSQGARALGIRRGMKVRQAQALCPQLHVIDNDPERDARVFVPIADGLDDVVASIEVMRPGLIAVDAGSAERFHGERAGEMLLDAAGYRGIDVFIGAADEITTAVLAARTGTIVRPGASQDFLAQLPIGLLAAEEALGCDDAVVDSLAQLGIDTLGQLAELPASAVTTRFGAAGARCHEVARAGVDKRVAPAEKPPDHSVTHVPEEEITRVDEAAFVARHLAARLHRRLEQAALACHRLRVSVELSDGTTLKRIWRTREVLTEAATADRVRWQLDGWLSAGGAGAIRELTLSPLEVAPPAEEQLWGQSRGKEIAHRAIERAQSSLGTDAVLQPRAVGGRGVAERIELVPFGEAVEDTEAAEWPGAILAPLPARLGGGPQHPAARIRLIDATASDIYVTAEALLSSVPCGLGWGQHRYLVEAWAGPWPVAGRWWAGEEQLARLQVVGRGEDGQPRAWLLMWVRGRWRVEATYA
ncbi:DNA polymerase [Corynebacterium yudongzhengii]|uniref:DNA polymerase Y family protein n=1 Tax=Corynebacterium yudongzhengii TaxID=2080740 RepID=A0A2U1T6Y7_9CORY|nr:DNA polymerase Y family protein [Corynebacterium yudongzhengii]AWB81321.1 DNA polymerase [Corynebacterium yudongzhengii]PWC01764.1 DNA polymerase Y family protein [Corynebacterium yudongzhengii]